MFRILMLPSTSKKQGKPWFLQYCDFLVIFEDWCKCTSGNKETKNKENNTINKVFLTTWQPLKKRAGSGSVRIQ
jgi:hypothetical protein